MGEHLPCKQGVKGSNPFISIDKSLKTKLLSFIECRFDLRVSAVGVFRNEQRQACLSMIIYKRSVMHEVHVKSDGESKASFISRPNVTEKISDFRGLSTRPGQEPPSNKSNRWNPSTRTSWKVPHPPCTLKTTH